MSAEQVLQPMPLEAGSAFELRVNMGGTANDETLYVLRAFGYLGLKEAGIVRFGQQEGALYLYDSGRFEGSDLSFDDGGWNGYAARLPDAPVSRCAGCRTRRSPVEGEVSQIRRAGSRRYR